MTQTQHSLIARMGHDIGDFCDRLIDRANASGTGLGGPEGPEPVKPSPRSARHPISQEPKGREGQPNKRLPTDR